MYHLSAAAAARWLVGGGARAQLRAFSPRTLVRRRAADHR